MKQLFMVLLTAGILSACQSSAEGMQQSREHTAVLSNQTSNDNVPYSVEQFACNNKKILTFSSAMVNGELKGSIQIDDVVIKMHQAPSASGIRMVANEKSDNTEWHFKGKEGIWSYYDGVGKEVLIKCKQP